MKTKKGKNIKVTKKKKKYKLGSFQNERHTLKTKK